MPSAEQARAGVVVCARNAIDQMLLGTWTAQAGFRGQAVSLLVLALEEAVKARALMAFVRVQADPTKRFLAFPETWLPDLLHSSHRRRHRLAVYQGVSDEMRAHLLGLTEAPPKQLDRDLDYVEWLEGADALKQAGLYSTFNGAEWKGPADSVSDDNLRQTTYYVFHFIQETVAQAQHHVRPGEVLPKIAPVHVRDSNDPVPTVSFSTDH